MLWERHRNIEKLASKAGYMFSSRLKLPFTLSCPFPLLSLPPAASISLYAILGSPFPFTAADISSAVSQLWPDEWFLKSSIAPRALQTLSAPTSITSNKTWTALTCSSNPSIVLVHGIDGDPIKTWTNAESSTFWPQDWLPGKFPLARVFSFGYNADMYRNNSVAGIRDNARSLLSFLELERESLDCTPPIVFIAHCLGGLIVKQVSSLPRLGGNGLSHNG